MISSIFERNILGTKLSHRSPVYPAGQAHRKVVPFVITTHVPPLEQNVELHDALRYNKNS